MPCACKCCCGCCCDGGAGSQTTAAQCVAPKEYLGNGSSCAGCCDLGVLRSEITSPEDCPGDWVADARCAGCGCPPDRVCGEACCPEGQTCVDGQCVPSCDPPCGFDDCCVDGECVSLQSLGSGLCVTYTCPNNDDACDAGDTGILCNDCQANFTPVTWDPNDPNWYYDALSQCPGGGFDVCSACFYFYIICEDAPP